MTQFEDHFSAQARQYASFRPQYPGKLFAYLASISPTRQFAWDSGTGNGQAARKLAKHFNRVLATDASAEQIAQAIPLERVEYRVARTEEVDIEPGCVDLVTVAMAVHWFDLESFYQVVRRVARANGILAVWMYHLPLIHPPIDKILAHYYAGVLAGYWPEKFHYLDELYRTLPFPFQELEPPAFEIQTDWELVQLVGFLESWSGTQRYLKEHGMNPIQLIWEDLAQAWGEPGQQRKVCWPLYLRVGRII